MRFYHLDIDKIKKMSLRQMRTLMDEMNNVHALETGEKIEKPLTGDAAVKAMKMMFGVKK